MSALVVMLFACFYLMFSRFGRIKLGDDDSKPEFSTFSWFAMLFSAGVGIGLLFFSIAEPVFYFDNTMPWGYPNNPFADLAGVHDMNEARAVLAMRVTYFHWGFHGWAVYVMVGLCLAYFGFRKKLPLTLRSALYPIIQNKALLFQQFLDRLAVRKVIVLDFFLVRHSGTPRNDAELRHGQQGFILSIGVHPDMPIVGHAVHGVVVKTLPAIFISDIETRSNCPSPLNNEPDHAGGHGVERQLYSSLFEGTVEPLK